MQCTLLIPGLFWPRDAAEAVMSGLRLPALATLLSRARADRFPPLPLEGWLCQAFQVERRQDWPVAPLTLELDGGDAADAYWLRADPVHLKVDRDRLLLIDSALFDVEAGEAHALVTALNSHFDPDAIVFQAARPKRWYARLPRPPELVTHAASEVAGRDVQRFLPTGSEARNWHALFNEVQMLLHPHPVNAAREERGEPPINSVWFWGGGVRTPVRGHPYDAVWSDDPLAIALATGADTASAACPANHAAWAGAPDTRRNAGSSHLIVLDELASASAHDDVAAWRERIASLEPRWFGPLLADLRGGRLARMALIAPGEACCWRFDLTRTDLLKFWRSARQWKEYA